ncbi:hypothetical protein L596_018733 [Steinernema carpocapsae]|uniref:Uncharacterized protein n=1 Tax=Steinernema carpocapsae TaxID=34508 RepID=A0A4U5N5R3_STECR|nr:hypothetical protein L596_018733 [Steinernema carpocapsae]
MNLDVGRMRTFSGENDASFEEWCNKFEDWADAQVTLLTENRVKSLRFYLEGNAREMFNELTAGKRRV